jgi:chorismate mutase
MNKWTVYYKDRELDGYDALAVCLKREAENSNLFIYPYYWSKLFKNEFMRMIYPTYGDLYYLRGELKLIEERVTNLRELGENIFQKPISEMFKSIFWNDIKYKNFQGIIKEEEEDPYKLSYNDKNDPRKIVDVIVTSNRDVNLFLDKIVSRFSSYKDVASYQLKNGKIIDVYFYKRAQILAHDLFLLYNYYLKNNSSIIHSNPYLEYLNFKNIDQLTAFSDYKLPQLLHSKGILVYSDDLIKEIEMKKIIHSKDVKEVEIRAATIVAVDEIASKLKTYPAFIDNVLWNLSKKCEFPYHRTISIYY